MKKIRNQDLWHDFEKTGSIGHYLLYKEVEKNKSNKK